MSGPLVCRCRVQPPSLEAAGQSHLARLLPFSPLSFPRERESSAPKPVTRPWISRLRGNDGNREVENPNAIALAFRGEREKKAKQPATLPRCVHAIAPARPPIEEGSGERDKGVSCCPRPLSCARVWGACGTINLSSDDALDVLQISCRSRARSRQGFSRGWAEAHPHPGPYRVAGQSHLARPLPFSPPSFPRKRESSAPKPVTRPWIPACEVVKKLFGLPIRDSLSGN